MRAAPDTFRRHQISAREYLRMGEVGVFDPDVRLELIAGEIVEMAPISSAHAGTVNILNRLLSRLVGDRAIVSVQQPVVADGHSVPQPDLALLSPRSDSYVNSHPTAADVLLLVEVADTTLSFDLGVKAALYSRSGIAELWVVDLQDRSVRVLREPSQSGYRASFTASGTDRVSSVLLPAVAVCSSDLFPG